MISIIIPCYNEEENINLYEYELLPVVERLSKEFQEEFEYVFIDDGSIDRTLEGLNRLSQCIPRCRVIPHGTNRGLGAAIRTGIRHCTGELIVCMDADLTFRPEHIADLIRAFRETGADCVSGSPYLKKEHTRNVASHRLFLSRTINMIYRVILGERITSISPIFRLYRSSALKELALESDNFEINAEILAKMIMNGRRVHEVPVPLHERRHGVSKINIGREIMNNIKLILKIIGVKYFNRTWK